MKNYFFSDLEICMSMAKPCALLGGFGACPPREFFKKVQFGAYFDPI